jgi:hypothetical protein
VDPVPGPLPAAITHKQIGLHTSIPTYTLTYIHIFRINKKKLLINYNIKQ